IQLDRIKLSTAARFFLVGGSGLLFADRLVAIRTIAVVLDTGWIGSDQRREIGDCLLLTIQRHVGAGSKEWGLALVGIRFQDAAGTRGSLSPALQAKCRQRAPIACDIRTRLEGQSSRQVRVRGFVAARLELAEAQMIMRVTVEGIEKKSGDCLLGV